jgi:hypothetical protein
LIGAAMPVVGTTFAVTRRDHHGRDLCAFVAKRDRKTLSKS